MLSLDQGDFPQAVHRSQAPEPSNRPETTRPGRPVSLLQTALTPGWNSLLR